MLSGDDEDNDADAVTTSVSKRYGFHHPFQPSTDTIHQHPENTIPLLDIAESKKITEVTYDPKRLQGVSVYQEIGRNFSKGDRIQFTAPSRELGVANRDLATIQQNRWRAGHGAAQWQGATMPRSLRPSTSVNNNPTQSKSERKSTWTTTHSMESVPKTRARSHPRKHLHARRARAPLCTAESGASCRRRQTV